MYHAKQLKCTLVEATSGLILETSSVLVACNYYYHAYSFTKTHAHTPQSLLFHIVSELFLAQHMNLRYGYLGQCQYLRLIKHQLPKKHPCNY